MKLLVREVSALLLASLFLEGTTTQHLQHLILPRFDLQTSGEWIPTAGCRWFRIL